MQIIKVPFIVFSYSVDLLNAIAISASAAVRTRRAARHSERYFRCSRLNDSFPLWPNDYKSTEINYISFSRTCSLLTIMSS